MTDQTDQRRRRLLSAAAATAALLATASVAVPAAGAPHRAAPASAARVAPAATSTSTTAPTTTASGGSSSTTSTTSRPHCTGCVEHQVFGFEDGTPQRWQPYGVAVAQVASLRVTGTEGTGPTSSAAAPHGGTKMLVVSGMGHGGGLRWPATTDATLSGFQVRVWVRSHTRTGTVHLVVSDSSGGSGATAVVTPGVWTPITTPRWMGNRTTLTVSLTQDNPCADGSIGGLDLDDTAIASSFSPEPAVWRSDDASLLAPALPQITVTTTPCPSTTTPTSQNTLLDFEDGTTQGWEGVGKAKLAVVDQRPLAGARSLRVRGLGNEAAAARLITPTSAWGGSGDWYRLVFVASGTQTVTVSPVPTCAPEKSRRADTKLRIAVTGASQIIGSRPTIGAKGSAVEVWFQLPGGSEIATVSVSALSRSVSPVLIDNVVLSRGTPPAGASASDTADESAGKVRPLCIRTSGKTTY